MPAKTQKPNAGPMVEVLPDPARRALKKRGFFPATDAQADALNSDADILLLGGAAGSLKTSTILVDLIQEREYPRMRSYFFRRTYPELEDAMDQAHHIFSNTGGKWNGSDRIWTWPSGAAFRFRHIQYEKDLYTHQGKQMSAVGFDEATHFPEKYVRYIITRNRSTDPGLNIRVRLGTNPGNVGHSWVMKMFFGGVCPHCEPDRAPPMGVTRLDGRWPSDGVRLEDPETGIKVSIAYILSYVRDHDLLGPQYVARLKMQSPSTAKALLEGCWKIFEGQYFDIWDPVRKGMAMVVPRRSVAEQWWWPRWVSADYGFTISSPAAHLFVRSPACDGFPRGRIYVIGEYGDKRETAAEFARSIVNRWAVDQTGKQQEYRWHNWYLDPNVWAERGKAGGAAFNLGSQMNDVLEPHGLRFVPAKNDRAGGAMRCYTMLDEGELVICDNCPRTIEAIATRIHDKDHENDVLKVVGDELDDYYDSWRYGTYSYVTADDAVKPVEIRIAEAMQKYDPTMAMIKRQEIIAEAEKEEEPIFYAPPNPRHYINQLRRNRRLR